MMMFLLALVFGALVLAMIFASCRIGHRLRTSATMPPSPP
jgi:tellurite resistance protein TehA-like permease